MIKLGHLYRAKTDVTFDNVKDYASGVPVVRYEIAKDELVTLIGWEYDRKFGPEAWWCTVICRDQIITRHIASTEFFDKWFELCK